MYKISNEKQATKLRCQIGNKEYVIFDLYDEFPVKLEFLKLSPDGFGYNQHIDDQIINRGKKETLKILEESKGLKNINVDTIDKVIDLVKQMTTGALGWN